MRWWRRYGRDNLAGLAPSLPEQHAMLAAAELARRWPGLAPDELRAIVRALIARVVMHPDQVESEILPEALVDLLQTRPRASPSRRTHRQAGRPPSRSGSDAPPAKPG